MHRPESGSETHRYPPFPEERLVKLSMSVVEMEMMFKSNCCIVWGYSLHLRVQVEMMFKRVSFCVNL